MNRVGWHNLDLVVQIDEDISAGTRHQVTIDTLVFKDSDAELASAMPRGLTVLGV